MADMKAWQLATPGEVQNTLKLTTVARPAPTLKPSEIQVRVISAAINPADHKVPAMGFGARAILPFPKTVGMDLSGEVVSAGSAVTDVLVGDRVMARLSPLRQPGSLSEYVTVPRDGLIADNVGCDPPGLYARAAGRVLLPEGVFVIVAAGRHIGHAAAAVATLLRPSFLGGGRNKVVLYMASNDRDDWAALAQWVNEGKLTAVIDKTFAFDDAREAFEHLQTGSARGKVVVHVSSRD
ncbi:GroES-like protein, partial [Metarhizium majus ARSEF 297]